jgi:hypothetical protein
MADAREPKVSARYRELGAEEPPRALDEAILAASRRAVDVRPAPLVAPTGRRRWYFPVAAAAIITLAVAVTVQVERQRPDEGFAMHAPARAPASAPAPVQQQKEELALKEEKVLRSAPAPKPAKQPREAAGSSSRGFTPDPAAPAPPNADALPDSLAKRSADAAAAKSGPDQAEPAARTEDRVRAQVQARRDAAETRRMESELQVKPESSGVRGSISAAPAPKPAAAPPVAASAARLYVGPERWLEQIVELRREGKHDDADRLLAEFRRSYPDYKLSDEMRSKVEKRQ